MIHTRFYLEGRYSTKSGYQNLLLRIVNNADWAAVSTHVKLKPSEWDGSCVINRPDATHLNAIINKFKSDIDIKLLNLSLEYDLESMRMSQVKNMLVADSTSISKRAILFSDVLSQYLNYDLSAGTREIYNTVLNKVTLFSGKGTRMKDIDHDYVVSFNRYLAQSQGVNGRSIYLRSLRAVCNYALHTNIIDKSPFAHFSIRTEPTKHRVVEISQLCNLLAHYVTPKQERYRDYFFLMLYLIGINATDLLNAKPDAIVNGRLEYVRAKTHKKYSIKIEPEAQVLLDKYAGKHHLVEALDHCQNVKSFIHMMNDTLRTIGDEVDVPAPTVSLFDEPAMVRTFVPVIPDISTYYARHTWATIASSLGVSIDVISQALGHSFGNRVTMIYIKPDQSKVDAANRLVIDALHL